LKVSSVKIFISVSLDGCADIAQAPAKDVREVAVKDTKKITPRNTSHSREVGKIQNQSLKERDKYNGFGCVINIYKHTIQKYFSNTR